MRSFSSFNNQRWWRLFKMSLTASATAAGKCKEEIFTENIMKMCHKHTNLIFNLFASTPHPRLSLFCDMAQAVAMHARSKQQQQQQHIFFIHYSCSRCCFISSLSHLISSLSLELNRHLLEHYNDDEDDDVCAAWTFHLPFVFRRGAMCWDH